MFMMRLQAKRELLAQVSLRYREAAHTQKSVILDEFVAATGYVRKYAIRLLARPVPQPHLFAARVPGNILRPFKTRSRSLGRPPISSARNAWAPFFPS